MRVLFHIQSETIGGYENQIALLLKTLPKNSFHLSLVCPPGSVRNLLIPYATEVRNPVVSTREWFSLLSELSPEAVFTVQGNILSLGAACKQHQIPAYWICGYAPSLLPNYTDIHTLAPLFFEHVLVPSEFLKGELQKIPNLKVTHLPCAVDTQHFVPSTPAETRSTRNLLGIDAHSFVIGYAARYAKHKRHQDLILLLSRLRKRGIDCHLLLLGWSDDGEGKEVFESLFAEMERLQVEDRVTCFTAYPTHVSHFLSTLDLFVSPAENEGLGCSILEAMSLEIPVVVARSGGATEPLSFDTSCGQLFTVGDIDGLERIVHDCFCNGDKLHAQGKSGRQIVKQYYSSNRLKERFLDILPTH